MLNPSPENATLIISEAGLRDLAAAGMTLGWLRGWLMSAGAHDVGLQLFDPLRADLQIGAAGRQLCFATDDELVLIERNYLAAGMAPADRFILPDPDRRGRLLTGESIGALLIPCGDIAYCRDIWLARWRSLCGNGPLQPLYIRADVQHGDAIRLEPGLSGMLTRPADGLCLNDCGDPPEAQLIAALARQGLRLRTVESCTGGGIAARICRVPGASAVFDRGWVTYSNAAKSGEVGVDPALIAAHGAVSKPVVRAMAEGGVAGDAADELLCVAVSGIAGPGGGTPEKPVGTVWIAVAGAGLQTVAQRLRLDGSRSAIQARTVIAALQLLLSSVERKACTAE